MATSETYRAGLDARRPFEAGCGPCAVLVLRVGRFVYLSWHATREISAELTPAQAIEIAGMLTAAAEGKSAR